MNDLPTAIDIGLPRILEMIPHRDPFLMIDRVTGLVSNDRATGVKDVKPDEYYFQGHFPGHPLMPGVLIIEAMAQTAAVLVVHTLGPEWEDKLVYFTSIDHTRFKHPVRPGNTLKVHVLKKGNRGRYWRFTSEAEVGGQICAEAEFAAMIMDKPSSAAGA